MKAYVIYCENCDGVSAAGISLNLEMATEYAHQRIKETDFPYWVDIININNEEITLLD